MVLYTGCLLLLQSLGKYLISGFPFTICLIDLFLYYSCIACTLVLVWPIVLSFYHHMVSNMPFTSNSFRSHRLQVFCKPLRTSFLLKKRVQFLFCGRVIQLPKWTDPPLFYSSAEHTFCFFCSRHNWFSNQNFSCVNIFYFKVIGHLREIQ